MVSLRTRQCCSSILTSGKETIENWFKWNKSFCQKKNKIWILHYHLPLSLPIFGGGSGFWPFEIACFPPFWAVRLCKCNSTSMFQRTTSTSAVFQLFELWASTEIAATAIWSAGRPLTSPLSCSNCTSELKMQIANTDTKRRHKTQTQTQNRKFNCLRPLKELIRNWTFC